MKASHILHSRWIQGIVRDPGWLARAAGARVRVTCQQSQLRMQGLQIAAAKAAVHAITARIPLGMDACIFACPWRLHSTA